VGNSRLLHPEFTPCHSQFIPDRSEQSDGIDSEALEQGITLQPAQILSQPCMAGIQCLRKNCQFETAKRQKPQRGDVSLIPNPPPPYCSLVPSFPCSLLFRLIVPLFPRSLVPCLIVPLFPALSFPHSAVKRHFQIATQNKQISFADDYPQSAHNGS